MAEIRLTFKITLTNGEETEQTISVPATNDAPFEQQVIFWMNKALSQYAQVGLLRQTDKDKFLLLCPSQIAFVECQLPSIVLAGAGDVPATPKVTLD